MNIKLIKMSYEYKDKLIEMIDEWKKDIEENHYCCSFCFYAMDCCWIFQL